MTTTELSNFIYEQAILLGFNVCGFAKAESLSKAERNLFEIWLNDGKNGEMAYMENHFKKRMDPTLLVEGCKSVVVVALNYFPEKEQTLSTYKVARFAYGQDYHFVVREKLQQLLQTLNQADIPVKGRAFCDSAPIAERYWAEKAGLGWIGKNQQLIVPFLGSYFLLGVLLIDQELDYNKITVENKCGQCQRCQKACPTGALDLNGLDSRKCISYLSIEKKGDFSKTELALMEHNNWIFGCDICQEVCPWNRFSKPNTFAALKPSARFLGLLPSDYHNLEQNTFSAVFGGTCIERTGLKGLLRNIQTKKKPDTK
jgi:epoxyqueuosine reductase